VPQYNVELGSGVATLSVACACRAQLKIVSWTATMADTSNYSVEKQLIASMCMHERTHTGQTMAQVVTAFSEQFNKGMPQKATLLDWQKCAFAL
jgi:hypothetical protein